jgi:peptidoglycan hydrolase FlgJ
MQPSEANVDLIPVQTGLPLERKAPAALEARASEQDAHLRAAAQDFEATFLAEMLKGTGMNTVSEEFGGGYGEDAFSSLLTQEYARLLAESGGIGLAEHIFESLKQSTAEE